MVSILLLRLNREPKDALPVNLIPARACGIVRLLMASCFALIIGCLWPCALPLSFVRNTNPVFDLEVTGSLVGRRVELGFSSF